MTNRDDVPVRSPWLALDRVTYAERPGRTWGPISFNANGPCVAVVGNFGAGKTTFLQMVCQQIQPTTGQLVIKLAKETRPNGLVTTMGSRSPQMPKQSGLEVVMASESRLPVGVGKMEAHALLDRVGLGKERYQKAANYGLLSRQRLLLAQALVKDTSVLVLDDPTVQVDEPGADSLLAILRRCAYEDGLPVVFSTEDIGQASAIASDILVLHHGRVLAAGPAEDLQRRNALRLSLAGALDLLEMRMQGKGRRPMLEGEALVVGNGSVIEVLQDAQYLGATITAIETLGRRGEPGSG